MRMTGRLEAVIKNGVISQIADPNRVRTLSMICHMAWETTAIILVSATIHSRCYVSRDAM